MPGSTPLLFTELRENLPSFTTGILPSQSIEELIAAGHIAGNPSVAPEQVQPSSLDLRIGPVAYRIRARARRLQGQAVYRDRPAHLQHCSGAGRAVEPAPAAARESAAVRQ